MAKEFVEFDMGPTIRKLREEKGLSIDDITEKGYLDRELRLALEDGDLKLSEDGIILVAASLGIAEDILLVEGMLAQSLDNPDTTTIKESIKPYLIGLVGSFLHPETEQN